MCNFADSAFESITFHVFDDAVSESADASGEGSAPYWCKDSYNLVATMRFLSFRLFY